ncbi:MAG TPA: M15 family metallopeptidase [Pilimelia sp.]|nr:M15 family metallopeptidase [Pilimelia sp.]
MWRTERIPEKRRGAAAGGPRGTGRRSPAGWPLRLQAAAGNRAVAQLLADRLPVARQTAPAPLAAVTAPAAVAPPAAAAPASYAVTEDDKAEFNALKGKIRKNNKKATPITTVEAYVEYRHDFFGSPAAYESAKALADGEFDAMPKRIWNKIGQTEPKDTKKVLYRWVRQAYVNAGIDDPVSVIKTGMTGELTSKVAAIKEEHPDLKAGGFVARPKKLGGYKLGTISEHGTGKAIDVAPQSKNPHIPRREWAFVLELAGTSVNRRLSRWTKDPGGLWQDLNDVNQRYVAELARRVADVRDKRVAAGRNPDEPPAFEEVLKGNPTLLKTARAHGVDHGVFDLGESVVTAFAAQGFVWGVTFDDPDLHHFEIR